MLRLLASLPLFLQLWGVGALAMLVPSAHAAILESHAEARIFLYAALLGLILIALTGTALAGRAGRASQSGQLVTLLGVMVLLPLYFAIPFQEAMRTTTLFNGYFEMLSAFTTTGATLFEDPARLSPTLHLWRALVAWLGGMLMWVAAFAILAPMNLGGFEVTSSAKYEDRDTQLFRLGRMADPQRRLRRHAAKLVPVYASLTLALWVGLQIAGEHPLTGLIHAMSVMATSGISNVGGPANGQAGLAGEALLFVFMIFALSRLTFSRELDTAKTDRLLRDPEFRAGMLLVVSVPVLLFFWHWTGAITPEGTEVATLSEAAQGFWGAMFTVMSFLTTTGFESANWEMAGTWSGLRTPGIILLGLALFGGGVATTAGGVKLLRVYALYRHGLREMERLVHPSSVGSSGMHGRRIRREGAYIAWIFFMLFALVLSSVTVALSLMGLDFETAIVMALACLANTGPVAQMAGPDPVLYSELLPQARALLAAAMVLGRLETLAIIALINPVFWRG